MLQPGRDLCGDVVVADIGIPATVIDRIGPKLFENRRPVLPVLQTAGHKYHRGHAVVVSGDRLHTGAARLAAQAALTVGAGLVTIAGDKDALAIHAIQTTAIMLSSMAIPELLQDRRKNAVCIGPALGIGAREREFVLSVLASGSAVVLDADALTNFADTSAELFSAIAALSNRPVVVTPHGGEFSRLFSSISNVSKAKHELALAAARASGAIVVFKGSDTVVAAPDGRAAINSNAPPWLATAGSGDVLAGLITGLLAQGMDAFTAACAAVWIHGEAARRHGRGGFTAETLISFIGKVI